MPEVGTPSKWVETPVTRRIPSINACLWCGPAPRKSVPSTSKRTRLLDLVVIRQHFRQKRREQLQEGAGDALTDFENLLVIQFFATQTRGQVRHARDTEHLHTGVVRRDRLGYGRHPHQIRSNGLQKPNFCRRLIARAKHSRVNAFTDRDAELFGGFSGELSQSQANMLPSCPGNLGPSRLSFGPTRGFVPCKLM